MDYAAEARMYAVTPGKTPAQRVGLMTKHSLPLRDRIEAMSIPEPNSGCRIWTGAVSSKGYGSIRINGKSLGAHRVAYELEKGPIPAGMMVCHHCDLPPCIEATHLYAGTNDDNMADMDKRNRRASQSGSNNGNAKVAEEQVNLIRAASGSSEAVGKRFGIKGPTVRQIRSGATWRKA